MAEAVRAAACQALEEAVAAGAALVELPPRTCELLAAARCLFPGMAFHPLVRAIPAA